MRPLEDFFRLSQRTGYQISPDGQHVSYLAPYERCLNLFVEPTGGGASVRLTSETERNVAGYAWAGPGRLLFMKDTAGDENYRLYGVNLNGSDLKAYTDFEGVRTVIIDDLENIDDQVLVGLNRRSAEVFDPYRLTLSTGELRQVAENPGNIQGWMCDHAGCLRVAVAVVDGVDTQILYRAREDEPFREVMRLDFHTTVSYIDFTADNRLVYAATNRGSDKMRLVLMRPETGEVVEELWSDPDYDVHGISYSQLRGKLLSASAVAHKGVRRHYFDAGEQAFREHIESLFPGYQVSVADCDKAEQHYLLYVGSDRTRGAYYYYDDTTAALRKIVELAPWLPEAEMAGMYPVSYTARDGLRIEAYLSLPAGLTPAEAHALPVIVNPHGGPWARDVWGFSSEVQFLCSRGYAVFQMNFRSSTGYGRRFLEAGYKQWGRAIQDDISDGVAYLAEQGIADPGRVAIYGGSFGGYAALAGVAFTPELYACAVDYVGVSNLFTFLQTIPPYWKPLLEMMYAQVGHPEDDKEMLAACSPALHADRIRVPVFVAQGANDPRVNKAESDTMVAALRERGVEVEYMIKEDEGHGFAGEQNRFDFYRAMERFLARHLHPDAPDA